MQAEVTVETFSKKGRGVASHGESKVEIAGGIPGDKVLVGLSRSRKGWRRGFLQKIIEASPQRIIPRCAHAPFCGGCCWQEISYSAQLKEKEVIVRNCFSSFSTEVLPIISCDEPWCYRNKMEFSFSQNREGEQFLGLMLAGSRGRVFNLTECHLVSTWFVKTLEAVRRWWKESGLAAYRISGEGSLRTLILREGMRTQDKLVMLTVSGNPAYALTQKQIDGFVQVVKTVAPEASIFLRIQQAVKGMPTQFYEIHLDGAGHLKEMLEIDTGVFKRSLTFKISPASFFQTNSRQAEKLYSRALQLVNLSFQSTVFDLYAGTATLGMALSLQAKNVVAVELNPYAIFDAEASAKINNISNLNFHCGDVGEVLAQLKAGSAFEPPELVIVDPPRAGLSPQALKNIIELQPEQILYISCNPKTQAENIASFEGYDLEVLQPVDQFPHTYHIENIALCKRKIF